MPNLKPGESQCNTAVSPETGAILERWVGANYKKRQVVEASLLLFDSVPPWLRELALLGKTAELEAWSVAVELSGHSDTRTAGHREVQAG